MSRVLDLVLTMWFGLSATEEMACDDSGTCEAPPSGKDDHAQVRNLLEPGVRCEPYAIDGFQYPFETGFRKEIKRVHASDLTPDVFYDTYVVPNEAVIIAGATANMFDGPPSAWSVAALKKNKHSGTKMPVKQRHVRLAGPPDDHLDVHEIFEQPNRTIMFKAIPFAQLRTDNPVATGKGRAKTFKAFLQKKYFNKLKDRTFIQKSDPKTMSGTFNLHLSNQGGAIPHSHAATLNLCLYGAKRWVMVNPLNYPSDQARITLEQIDKMDDQRFSLDIEDAAYTSQMWFRDEGLELLKSMKVPYYDFILQEGEAIFIPDYWTHGTMDLCRATVGVELMGEVVHSGYSPKATARFTHHGFAD